MIKISVEAEDGAPMPIYSTEEAAGADLCAYISEEIVLEPGQRALIPTGLKFAIPKGYEVQIRPRSGLALKSGVTVLNTPGTIDSDYRGEIKIIVINHGTDPFVIAPKMRIAQAVVAPVTIADFVLEEIATTARGSGGFGHTGV